MEQATEPWEQDRLRLSGALPRGARVVAQWEFAGV